MFRNSPTKTKTRFRYFSLISLIGFLIACSVFYFNNIHTSQKYAAEQEAFNDYLKKTFNTRIGHDTTNYIILSDEGCHGCISETIKHLYRNRKSVFVLSRSNYLKNSILFEGRKERLLIDTTSLVNDLSYHNGNIGVIQTCNDEIFNIMSFDLSDMSGLIALE